MISDINRKRLEFLSTTHAGEIPPEDLLGENVWVTQLSEMAVEVLAELDRLNKELNERN